MAVFVGRFALYVCIFLWVQVPLLASSCAKASEDSIPPKHCRMGLNAPKPWRRWRAVHRQPLTSPSAEGSKAIHRPRNCWAHRIAGLAQRVVVAAQCAAGTGSEMLLAAAQGRKWCREDVPVRFQALKSGCDILSGATQRLGGATSARVGNRGDRNQPDMSFGGVRLSERSARPQSHSRTQLSNSAGLTTTVAARPL